MLRLARAVAAGGKIRQCPGQRAAGVTGGRSPSTPGIRRRTGPSGCSAGLPGTPWRRWARSGGSRWRAWGRRRAGRAGATTWRPGSWPFTTVTCPGGQPVSMTRLIRAAGLRWPAEEDFGLGKDCFGLDESQVRLYTAIARHTVLVMAALAICAVTAALLRCRTDTRAAPPATPGQPPPADPGMIPLTVPEIRRLLAAPDTPRSPSTTPPVVARLAFRAPDGCNRPAIKSKPRGTGAGPSIKESSPKQAPGSGAPQQPHSSREEKTK